MESRTNIHEAPDTSRNADAQEHAACAQRSAAAAQISAEPPSTRTAYLDVPGMLHVLVRLRNRRFILEVSRPSADEGVPPTLRRGDDHPPPTVRSVAARLGLVQAGAHRR